MCWLAHIGEIGEIGTIDISKTFETKEDEAIGPFASICIGHWPNAIFEYGDGDSSFQRTFQ